MLLIECESVCPAGAKCENQFFQKRMYPPLYTFNTGGKGWGLKADTDLKKGSLFIEFSSVLNDYKQIVTNYLNSRRFCNRIRGRSDRSRRISDPT